MNKKPITFVNFCVDIGRDKIDPTNSIHRSFDLYRIGMEENINTNVPLVVYTSVNDINIPEHRNDDNILIKEFTTETIESEFPDFENFKKTYPTTSKDEIATLLFYYVPLVVLKMKKIVDTIHENPFQSDMFFWMDCHFTRGILDQSFLTDEQSYLNMYENLKDKIGDKFLLFNHTNRPYGFFWGGTKEAILKVYEEYFKVFFDNMNSFLYTEEVIFRDIYSRKPELFNFVDITEASGLYKVAVSDYITK